MLGFVEEIVLLQLDEASGNFVDLPVSVVECVVAGAALMELAIRNRIDTDLERLIILDASRTGDDILDDVLARLAGDGDGLTATSALERITPEARRYQQRALKRLIEKGVLGERNGRFLWVFHRRSYPVIDARERQEVRARLRQLLLTDEIPDPQDVVLICLIEACDLLGLVLTPAEIAAAGERVAQLGRLDLIGQAVTKSVGEIRFVVRHAAGPSY